MTFEKSRATWPSGFLGYKDNSPEAKQRRSEQRYDHLTVMVWRKGTISVLVGSPAEKILSESKFCKRVK